MATHFRCPACAEPCHVTTTRQVTPTVRTLYLQCLNEACGWSGRGISAVQATITPSRLHQPRAEQLTIRLDALRASTTEEDAR